MKTIILTVLAMGILTLAACDKQGGTSETASKAETDVASAPATAKSDAHAPAGVVPGSYEDWCNEHAVPESMCTRCNPDLIAAFKATGDWCAEHGLPESQCLACNPDLKIVRPAKTEEPKTNG
jgi:hypothetical protein